jgi:hypothetical protein
LSIQRDEKATESVGQDGSLRALALELKSPLINIARQAELGESSNMEQIQQTAEQALKLIDHYLLSAQSEYGQLALGLEPVNLGSVLYDASSQLRHLAREQNVELVLEDKVHEPVMTHGGALTAVLAAFGRLLMPVSGRPELTLRSYKTRDGFLCVGVFTDADLSQDDLRDAMELQGKANMSLAGVNSQAHVSLSIAEKLCRAMGGDMTVKKIGKLRGFATQLPRSEQLSLV